ncbi:MAG: hypothetical protein PVJ09_05570 [Candidatus Woesebacteria bacterium]|jgi:hypothetical protein
MQKNIEQTQQTILTQALFYPKRKLLTVASLLTISLLLPTIVHQQFITGPIINAILLITVSSVGVNEAMMMGLIPSTVALSSGLLPLALAPMLPFIMISNAIYILLFARLFSKNYFLAITAASIFKFIFLYGTSKLIVSKLLAAPLMQKVAVMMTYPQLVTALIGGLIAYLVIKSVKNYA